ncbi:unnamed protein product, partial [Laminaria digitata]
DIPVFLFYIPPSQSRHSVAYPKLPFKTAPALAAAAVATLLAVLLAPAGAKPIVLVMGICGVGIIVTGWLADTVLSKDDGTPAMRAVSDPIKVRSADAYVRGKCLES